MTEIEVLSDVSVIWTYFKLIHVKEEPSAVANITEMVIDTNDSIETAANSNITSVNTGASKESELANIS